jgi:hypothetical protein
MRALLLVAICLFAFSCKKKIDLAQYQDGQQLLTVNDVKRNGDKIKEPRIMKISTDSVFVGEEFLVKIFLEDADLKIVDAFFNCNPVASPTVDTTTYKVSGCSNGLIVKNDTILIGFSPTELGVQKFPEITILTKDKESIFRTLKYSFEYKIVTN